MMTQGLNISSLKVRVKQGQEENLKISARLLYVQDANQGFRIETDGGSRSDMIAGRKLQLREETSNVRVINTGTGELIATLVYGHGDVEDSAVTGEVTVKNASQLNSMSPVSLNDAEVHTVASKDTRQKLVLMAGPDNAGTVWIGSAKNTGIPLMAGDAFEIVQFDGAVNLCGDGAGQQTVYLMEVLN